MRRLRQLPGVRRLAVLVIGDIAIAIATYELAWHIRTLSSLGIFEAALPKNVLAIVPHNYGMVILSQAFLLWIAGLYKINRSTSGKILLRIPFILFVQMMSLSLFYLLTFGRGGSPLSIFPVFWILNSISTSLWRILTFYPGPLSTFFAKMGKREGIISPTPEVTRHKMLKFKPVYKLMNFFGKDLARVFILGFMILLISCAFLLIFRAEKTAEEVVSVAYFLLVIGVGMKFVSMVRHKDHEKLDNGS